MAARRRPSRLVRTHSNYTLQGKIVRVHKRCKSWNGTYARVTAPPYPPPDAGTTRVAWPEDGAVVADVDRHLLEVVSDALARRALRNRKLFGLTPHGSLFPPTQASEYVYRCERTELLYNKSFFSRLWRLDFNYYPYSILIYF